VGSGLGETEYTGELISLDFKDGDIQDIFRLFADISGLNIVVQPGVTGRITLKLTEVPWDQALELILKTNKLGFIVEGNVIRIAPLSDLATEEAEKRRLAEEQALAGDLFTQTRVLSYAKASEIMPLLQRNLSPRGDIVTDERTNTVIFTDLAAGVASINELIDSLDTPIPGVEIEARIVVTTRTFARQLGVQWGFTSNQTQALGNTTELVFPNRVQLDGQGIGSSAINNFRVPGLDTGGLAPPTFAEGEVGTVAQRGYAVNLPFAGAPTGAVGLSLGSITGAFNIDAAISAAERRGQVRIISAPKIITQNNKQAEIKQGTTFPVQVVANNTITVQFKDAVLELLVTPQITSADTIILDLEVNNDSLDFGRSVNGIPSIVTQAATTQVLVADGSTTVIGGVFVNTSQLEEQYVPLLHKIPILGYLFKTKNVDTRNEELLIFLTPRIRKDTV
jgi:type IV pilus assembly protein PilQ